MSVLLSLAMALTIFTPFSSAYAKEKNGNGKNEKNEKMVQVVLYSDEDGVIMAEVPKSYEKEYKTKLKDSDFRNAEIQRSLGANTFAVTASTSSVYYMRKAEVIKMVDSLDKSFNWSTYISNPLTDVLVGKAVAIITKSNFYGALTGVLGWSTSWIAGKHEMWWKDSAIMILRKQITGVKMTVTPGPPSGYPAAYITYTRY